MYDDMEDKFKDNCFLHHEKWCDLLYTLEAKDNQNKPADQIKRIAAFMEAPEDSGRDAIHSVSRYNNDINGFLQARNKQIKKPPK